MMDKVFAALSLIMLTAFVGVVVGFVREVDLAIVILVVVLMASYDFWKTLRNGNDKKS